MTMVEVVIAAIICGIVILGASFFFVTGRSQVSLQGNYRQAIQLAAQKIEELKAGGYDQMETEDFTFESVSYVRSIKVEDVSLYKTVKVTVQWSQMGKQRSVSLDTYIAPK